MIKLLKNLAGQLHYWEIWKNGDLLTTHYGIVGEKGACFETAIQSNESASMLMRQQAQQKIKDGFASFKPDALKEVIICYKINGFGDVNDLDKRHAIQALMDEVLGWTGNGHCDGGDIGSGDMNIYCMTVEPNSALETIRAALDKQGFLSGAELAFGDFD